MEHENQIISLVTELIPVMYKNTKKELKVMTDDENELIGMIVGLTLHVLEENNLILSDLQE